MVFNMSDYISIRLLKAIYSVFHAIFWSFLLTSAVFAGRIGKDTRVTLPVYAAQKELDLAAAQKMFGATGRIMCPFGESSAFLVHKNNVVVTARHVLYPEKEMGAYGGRTTINRCGFELFDGAKSTWYTVDVQSFVTLEAEQRSVTDRFDWIAMRLVGPLPAVEPYRLPSQPAATNEPVTMATIRQEGMKQQEWNDRIVTDCKVRQVKDIDAVAASGLWTDCDATIGASGSPLLRMTENGAEVVGIQSSVSPNCREYKHRSCSSFAVGMYPEVITAIKRLAGQP